MRTFGVSLYLRSLAGKEGPAATFRRVLDEWSAERSRVRGLARRADSVSRGSQTLHRFEFTQTADTEGTWTTVARMLEDSTRPDQVALAVEMNLDGVADRLAPLRVTVRPPGFLRKLRGECVVRTIDGFDAPPGVLNVYDAGQVELLANEIFSPDRKLPLVVVTDPVYEPAIIRDLPGKLASYLFALARVVHVTPRMTYSLTAQLGKDLSVFDGAVRTYWPGAKKSDVGPRHPLILRRTLASWGPQAEAVERELLGRLSQGLIRAAAPRFRPHSELVDFERGLERERVEASSATVQELKTALADTERKLADAKEYERIALADNTELRTLLDSLEQELRTARADLFAEHTKAVALEDALRARGAALAPVIAPAAPSTEDEAVERGRQEFAEWVIIPGDIVLDTDLGASVYQVLRAMAEACKAERAGALRDQALFRDLLSEHLGHPGRYEPGPTGVRCMIDGEMIELRDRIHLRNTRPTDTETIYFAVIGKVREQKKYVIARIGRHV